MRYLLDEIDIILNNILTIGIHIVDKDIISNDIIDKCNNYNLLFLETQLSILKDELKLKDNISKITKIICVISQSLQILKNKMDYDILID